MEKTFFILGCLLAALSVAAGAFGAHIATRFMTAEQIAWLEKAARYNLYHALALFPVAWALTRWVGQAGLLNTAGWCFVAGILLFSGSLYIMSFSGLRLGWVTPIGGAAFLLGWILLATAAWRS
ncbi:MAG: DUF423 domain-containing protein [Chloroflexi bacterium]|nr:DUF423 domain-containing protein [Chloroflexota bacterium]